MSSRLKLSIAQSSNALVEKALLLLAFLAPGAWLIYTLPSQPFAQLFFVGSAVVWVAVIGFNIVPTQKLDRRILIALGVFLAVVGISTAVNPFIAQALFYDVYGEMPLILWFCYILMFVLAAKMVISKKVVKGIQLIFFVGLALVCFACIWRFFNGMSLVFGSPAFAVPALAPLVVIGITLGKLDKRKASLYYLSVLVFIGGLIYAMGGLLSLVVIAFLFLLIMAICPELLRVPQRFVRPVRVFGWVCLGLVGVGVLAVQLPFLRQVIPSSGELAHMEQSISSRILLWDGAQRMFAGRPIFGYGSAGYRINAIRYYDEAIFPLVASLGGDPISFSSPSPHSIFWDALLRLGIVGTGALLALFIVWVGVLRERLRNDNEQTRLIRLMCAIGFLAYVFSLLFTPIHFASGLLGAVMGGMAIAPNNSSPQSEQKRSLLKDGATVIGVVALLVFGVWKCVGLSLATVDPAITLEANLENARRAARIIPGEPFNERHLLEWSLAVAQTEEELHAAQKAIDAAPGYILNYGPNLAWFAQYSLEDARITGRTDLTWERSLLERAQRGYPKHPLLVDVLKRFKDLERTP